MLKIYLYVIENQRFVEIKLIYVLKIQNYFISQTKFHTFVRFFKWNTF